MGQVGGLQILERQFIPVGIQHLEPVATPAGIGPAPLRSIESVSRHEHANVCYDQIHQAHVHIEADGLPPATDGQLVPASVAAFT